MTNSQMHLHSENFDLCRICLLEPESNRHIKFIHIFTPSNGEINLNEQMIELLGVKVEKDDIKPKMICETCHCLLMGFIEMKKKAAESQIVINYIATKKFGVTNPGTSNASYSSPDSRNKEESTKNKSSSFTSSRSISNNLNENNYNINGCSSSSIVNSNNKQVDSNRSFITNHSKSTYVDSESDDDDPSCSVVKDPVEIVDLLSSDSEETCKSKFKNECINEDDKLYYCSICQKKNILNHDCSQYNKSFFTCLVPNCNILSRSKKDFTPHYRRHIGLSSTAVMCRRCYQEIKRTDRDASGHYHIRCRTVNLFKCYACSVVFNSMAEFAFHKLKIHNGRLMNSFGNYLCFYCEKSVSDLTQIIEHTKHCLENQAKNVTECGMKLKEPTENETELLPVKKTPLKNVPERKRGNVTKKIPRSSTHILFTCLKPSCNLIFQNFNVFKCHHRQHFELGNTLMCWQCCVPFANLNNLRGHQVKGNCRVPGMFKCYECSEQFNDLQSLSIHKYTLHNGDLVSNKKNKNLICAYCHKGILLHNFKSHLITCQYNNVETNLKTKPKSKTTYTKKYKSPYKCTICNKVCLTAAALSSHIKIHNPSPQKKIVKKRTSNTSLKTNYPGLGNMNNPNLKGEYLEAINACKEEPEEENENSTFHFDEAIESIIEMDTTDENNEIDAEMTTLSDHYPSNETTELVNNDTYPIKCNNCPRKFKSNSGLARHWQFCDQQNTLRSKPQNYYCTKCKKYFTRLTFFQHWRVFHGKRLPYHKYRRFSCKQCPFKFMYQIALLMHIEHEHGVEDNTAAVKSDVTPINCIQMLPIISETTSLANNISATTTTIANNIPETTSMANNIPETTSMASKIPDTISMANNIPETTSMASKIPDTISMAINIPETTSMANTIFETASMANNIPETTSMANNIPETVTENNKEHYRHIKQEANANTLSDQWELSDNKIKENITAHSSNEGNNEEPDISNNNDNGENGTDVYTAQSINQIIEQLNDSETIDDLLYDEDTMAVNNAYSMDISENANNYIDKTITKMDKNETSMSSVVKEENQNCLDSELVALNKTENVNHGNENKIHNSVQALPCLDE